VRRRPHQVTTIELLLKGDQEIVEIYRRAQLIWKEILRKGKSLSRRDFATLVHDSEDEFITLCRDKYLGCEVMGLSGIGQFCSKRLTVRTMSNPGKAQRIWSAMCEGRVHQETLTAASGMASMYGISLR
jgi:hypothetical protein